MTNWYRLTVVTGWGLALGASSVFLSGCKSNAQPQSPPPPEVSVIELKREPAKRRPELGAPQESIARTLIRQKSKEA